MSGYSESEFQVKANTFGTFNGWNLRECWANEDEAWARMVSRDESNGYPFPMLRQSIYLEDETRNLHKPIICQDMSWSHDGTSFVTVHDDYGIRQYLVPDTELAEGSVKELIPFTRSFKNQSVVSSRVHPGYSLFNESDASNLILLAMRGVPLQLCPLQSDSGDLQASRSFDVSNFTNGTYHVPHAIDFHGNSHFLAGFERNRICLYDINRSSPLWVGQSTKKECGSSVHRAIVSCFDKQANAFLPEHSTRVCGTYKNELHMIDIRTLKNQFLHKLKSGRGIIQILKSENGHYLYTLKRNSNLIDILDMRQPSKKLNALKLPFNLGAQKFKASLTAANGLTIGTDYGSVINWPRDLVEFGGNDRTFVENSQTQKLGADTFGWEFDLPYGNSRINLIEESPVEPGLFLVSYSPDKFAEPSTSIQSGLGLVYHPTA